MIIKLNEKDAFILLYKLHRKDCKKNGYLSSPFDGFKSLTRYVMALDANPYSFDYNFKRYHMNIEKEMYLIKTTI